MVFKSQSNLNIKNYISNLLLESKCDFSLELEKLCIMKLEQGNSLQLNTLKVFQIDTNEVTEANKINTTSTVFEKTIGLYSTITLKKCQP